MTRWVRWLPTPRLRRLAERRNRQNGLLPGIRLPVQSIRWMPEDLEPLPLSTAVTLGFRDGTTASVSADTAEGEAFRTVAAVLVRRDG
jgi:hypothetical protein